MSDNAIDWEQLDMIADGFTADFVEIYREFEVDLPRLLGDAAAACAVGDAIQLARAAHQAKGSAANFGFTGFSETMAEVEARAKADGVTGLDAELRAAERLFRESLARVRSERGI